MRTSLQCKTSKKRLYVLSRSARCTIEPLENRQLLTNTIQVDIPVQISAISAKDLQNVGVDFKLHDVIGTLTATGENISAQTVGNKINIAGTISSFDGLSLATTTPASTITATSKATDIPLLSFQSIGPMKSIDLRPFELEGSASLLAAPKVQLGDGKGVALTVSQTIPLVNFTAGNFSNSQINFTAANPTAKSPALVAKFGNLMDTHFTTNEFIKTMNLHSVTESTTGGAGISANSAGAIGVASDYKADFKMTPTFGLKYTLSNFYVGGTASGRWDVPGITKLSYANITDSNFIGNFGTLSSYTVKKDFSGSLTAGSMGTGIIGHDMINGTMNFTNPFAANSWNVGNLAVGSTIENSTITSNGNLGTIQTMYTYYSRIMAGITPTYTFGQPLSDSTYTSNSLIKSFTSDCPSHHYTHFVGSYVGAYDLQAVHLGNVQTTNYAPFGLAGVRMDNVSVLLNSKTVNLRGLNSTTTLDASLQKYGLTEQSLGDFKMMFEMQ